MNNGSSSAKYHMSFTRFNHLLDKVGKFNSERENLLCIGTWRIIGLA